MGRAENGWEEALAGTNRREFPKRSSTTCPRACVCQGTRDPRARVRGRARRRAAGRSQGARCPGAEPRGRPLAGSAQGRRRRRRRRPGFPGLPLAWLRAHGEGSGRGGGDRRRGAGSPRGVLHSGPGASGAASAASLSPGASGRRFGLSPPRCPPLRAPAPRPRPRPGARLPRRPGSEEPAPAELRGSRG